jgi:hypothetical protein
MFGMSRGLKSSNPLDRQEGIMPYDPRPVSKGGNRGIDELFSRNAKKGKFRVIGVDTFDGGDWLEGEFKSLEEAKKHIAEKTKGQQMLKMYIYDEVGNPVGSAGSF